MTILNKIQTPFPLVFSGKEMARHLAGLKTKPAKKRTD